ncbi:MAG: 3-phosphoshikimate 1-carboxyvinyltransferase [Bacteroidia bacterium]|nr:3-phosphoshikimate 1-carboxyvinyltransferase [Bacteroidia bacterium]
MIAKISAPQGAIRATIHLPASKSLSNRALIIRALSGKDFEPDSYRVENLSEAEDTKILLSAIQSSDKIIDVGAAGTAMRFLTAYFAISEGEKILTGTERMKQRPIAPLVEALKVLGADIEYLENTGFPPIGIKGKRLTENEVEVDGSISSQFLSALLMIAPALENGLIITVKGNLVSKPYAKMTIALMKHFGVSVLWKDNRIEIPHQNYIPQPYTVEADWSAAAFWYSVVALSKDAEINLPGLQKNSLQGDSVLPELMKQFGVETEFSNQGIILKKSKIKSQKSKIEIDFVNFPDLVQSLTVVAAALDFEVQFSGIENLKLKETDRIAALQTELKKFGKEFVKEKTYYTLKGKFKKTEQIIESYDDHRMVMAFAPLAFVCGNIGIENPETVKKSYPEFWEDLQKCY